MRIVMSLRVGEGVLVFPLARAASQPALMSRTHQEPDAHPRRLRRIVCSLAPPLLAVVWVDSHPCRARVLSSSERAVELVSDLVLLIPSDYMLRVLPANLTTFRAHSALNSCIYLSAFLSAASPSGPSSAPPCGNPPRAPPRHLLGRSHGSLTERQAGGPRL